VDAPRIDEGKITMSLLGNATVTIWHNMPEDGRADYYEWHNREHVHERLGIPGFLRGRRYVSLYGDPEFCTLYEADSLDVLTGPYYLARLESPTPMTRRVASRLMGNVRSLCHISLTLGSGQGGLLMTWRYNVEPGRESSHRAWLEERLHQLALRQQIVGVHLCLADSTASAVQTAEKKTRLTVALTPGWVILVEGGGDRAVLEQACADCLTPLMLEKAGANSVACGLYQLQFQGS
jgi:hypothetical protein